MRNFIRFSEEENDSQICGTCTSCCRWDGEVLFAPQELDALADLLHMDVRDCAEKFFELSDDRRNLRLRMGKGDPCPFLSEKGCTIYKARPDQCRNFPYVWVREEAKLMEECKLFKEILKRNNLTLQDLQNEKDRTCSD